MGEGSGRGMEDGAVSWLDSVLGPHLLGKFSDSVVQILWADGGMMGYIDVRQGSAASC